MAGNQPSSSSSPLQPASPLNTEEIMRETLLAMREALGELFGFDFTLNSHDLDCPKIGH